MIVEVMHPQLIEPPETQVVFSTNAQGEAEIAQDHFEEGQVLLYDLLLEGLGVSGHHNAAIFLACPEDHGHKIGQALSTPVPASTTRCVFVRSAVSTASAISSCWGRCSYADFMARSTDPIFPESSRSA